MSSSEANLAQRSSSQWAGHMLRMPQVVALTAVVLLASACMPSEPPPPPFRVEAMGPGLESNLPGHLARLKVDDDVLLRARSSRLGFRLQDGGAVPIERVRLRSQGWVVQNRRGDVVCNSFLAQEHDSSQLTLACDEGQSFMVRQNDGVLRVDRGAERFAIIEPHEEGVLRIEREGAADTFVRCEEEEDACLLSEEGDEVARLVGARWSLPSAAIGLLAHVGLDDAVDRDAAATDEGLARLMSLAWLHERLVVLGNPFTDDDEEDEVSGGHRH